MTYSIVARDPATGALGVAVQTALPGVGRLCPWAEAGVGAVATQSLVRVSHGPSGLTLLRNGHSASQALAGLIAADPHPHLRQLGIVDADGGVAAHTGTSAIPFAGQQIGAGYSVQANMMLKDTVPGGMAQAYESADGPFALRLVAALRAAQDEGGDIRGQQSAALRIVSATLPKNDWDGVLFDVRVDDHDDPVGELARLCRRHLAYKLMDEAETLAAAGDLDGALVKADEAIAADPDELQPRYWFALTLADAGHLSRVESILRAVFTRDRAWVVCTERYAQAFPFRTPGLLEAVLALAGAAPPPDPLSP